MLRSPQLQDAAGGVFMVVHGHSNSVGFALFRAIEKRIMGAKLMTSTRNVIAMGTTNWRGSDHKDVLPPAVGSLNRS